MYAGRRWQVWRKGTLCTLRQPVRHEVVTHVFGTYLCLRAGQLRSGAAEGIRTPDPRITNALLYQLSYRGARPDQ
jgi:hypothetical protein